MAGYLGNAPTAVPLSSADLQDSIITSAKIANGTILGADINSTFDLTGKTVTLPSGTGGKVLQVVQATKTDTASWSASQTRVDTGLSASITPSSASNKILILWQLNIGYDNALNQWFLHLDRSGTEINLGDSAGSKKRANSTHNVYSATAQDFMAVTTSGMFLDSPSTTSSRTYKLQHSSATSGGTFYINRSSRDGDYTYYDGRFVSNIILMEVAG